MTRDQYVGLALILTGLAVWFVVAAVRAWRSTDPALLASIARHPAKGCGCEDGDCFWCAWRRSA